MLELRAREQRVQCVAHLVVERLQLRGRQRRAPRPGVAPLRTGARQVAHERGGGQRALQDRRRGDRRRGGGGGSGGGGGGSGSYARWRARGGSAQRVECRLAALALAREEVEVQHPHRLAAHRLAAGRATGRRGAAH